MQALKATDHPAWEHFATFLLYPGPEGNAEQQIDHIIWTDEAQFKLNGMINRHKAVCWSLENPHEIVEKELNAPGVMTWVGICPRGIIGPFFF